MLICNTRGVPKSVELSSSWEANGFSAGQEIIFILWKTKVHYRSLKRPPPLSILSEGSVQVESKTTTHLLSNTSTACFGPTEHHQFGKNRRFYTQL